MLAQNLNKNLSKIVLVALAASFGFLALELILMGHTGGPRVISVIATALGAVLSFVALSPGAGLRRIVAILLVVVGLAGLLGFMSHSGARGFRQQAVTAAPATEDRTVRRALSSFGNLPPTLSPLSITGLALLAAAVTLASSAEATKKA